MSEAVSNNTEKREAMVDQQILEDSAVLENKEDDQIMIVDNHNISLVNMVEAMRSAGILLNKCKFRKDIESALSLLELNPKAFSVFIVDHDLLVNYGMSKR